MQASQASIGVSWCLLTQRCCVVEESQDLVNGGIIAPCAKTQQLRVVSNAHTRRIIQKLPTIADVTPKQW